MRIIPVTDDLRLRSYDGHYEIFLPAYQDPFIYQNSEGIFDDSRRPDLDYVKGMCDYLSMNGDLYYIEAKEGDQYIPIGDVTIKSENPPIAIWKDFYRGKGIGKKVMRVVIEQLKEKGETRITRSCIYKWNHPSKRMHDSLGFHLVEETEDEWIMELNLVKS